MASAAQAHSLTVEQYLRTPFRPDVDYVDGFIEERNLGEFDHGALQFAIASYFNSHRKEWKIRMALDTRIQTSRQRFRIPDVSILDAGSPAEQIIRTAPLLCIEVLSPEDTLRKMLQRVQDYFTMGVPHVWIFDPQTRKVFVCRPGGGYDEQSTGTLNAPGTAFAVDLAEIFRTLDED